MPNPVSINIKFAWKVYILFIFFGIAYFEEQLWDLFVQRDHPSIFGWTYNWFRKIIDNSTLALIVPILVMPQIVHYILDAYIWRKKHNSSFVKN